MWYNICVFLAGLLFVKTEVEVIRAMSRNKALALYLSGTLGQILAVCFIVFLLRKSGVNVDYTTTAGMSAIGIGGISSALWGAIIAIKYKKYSIEKMLKDFFKIKQKYRHYLFVLCFLSLDFFHVAFGGKFLITSWYMPFTLFGKAILFGGIEEIGWRYVFQPILQERRSYIVSTLITFCAWGIWHFLYFYVEGTLSQVQGFEFLLGLLANCFILSALYIKTKSLWICVVAHSLINVLSQLAIGGNQYVSYACKIIIIAIAIFFSIREQNKNEMYFPAH